MAVRKGKLLLFGSLVLIQLLLTGALVWDAREYYRIVTFFDEVELLADAHATVEEVRSTLGEPMRKSQYEGTISWWYNPGDYRGYSQRTCVFDIDPKTQRVSRLGYITSR